jgi:arylsulfatase A-like enzyme/Flp pilus assembly protein TadD
VSPRRRALLRPLGAALAAACCAAALGACGSGRDAAPGNLLLVTLDTTRADRLGCYGHAGAVTPHLDRLAAEGALGETAIAVAPLTLPSHVSLLTGLYPPSHGVRDNSDRRLPPSAATLAEHLQAHGFATAAVVGAYVLSADFGLDQGFEVYDEPRDKPSPSPGGRALQHRPIAERPASDVAERVLELLERPLAEPFFLWVHFFDPHQDYEPPARLAQRFAGRPYDGEIAFVDEQLGRILDALARDGRLDRTLVAVTGDHGESLGEHGEGTHGLFVYEATLRVPLLARWPGRIPAGTRIVRLVSGVDLAPTLVELLGLPPLAGPEGTSFAPALRGEPMAVREPVYSEAHLPLRAYGWSDLRALHSGERKFIEAPEPELYDLRADPAETRNLAATHAEEVARWRERLASVEGSWREPEPGGEQVLDAEARARLESLGYLAGARPAPATRGEARADPKSRVEIHDRLLRVQALVAQGRTAEAAETLAPALAADPANPAALALHGTLLCARDACGEGLAELEQAARLAPDVYEVRRNLANALHLAGRFAEAAEAYRAAIELHPFSSEDRYGLGNVLFAAGDVAGAVAAYDEALRLGPASAPLLAAAGVARVAAGDAAAGEAALRQAVEADPALADAWHELGKLLEQAGRADEADAAYGRAVAARPDHLGALSGRVRTALQRGDTAAAERALEQLEAARPGAPARELLAAQIALARGDEASARRILERLVGLDGADPRAVAAARAMLSGLGRPAPAP